MRRDRGQRQFPRPVTNGHVAREVDIGRFGDVLECFGGLLLFAILLISEISRARSLIVDDTCAGIP